MNFQSQVNVWYAIYNDTNNIESLYEVYNEIKQLKDKYCKIIKYNMKEILANHEYLYRIKILSKLMIETREKYELIVNEVNLSDYI
jgi:hypothetical protein